MKIKYIACSIPPTKKSLKKKMAYKFNVLFLLLCFKIDQIKNFNVQFSNNVGIISPLRVSLEKISSCKKPEVCGSLSWQCCHNLSYTNTRNTS